MSEAAPFRQTNCQAQVARDRSSKEQFAPFRASLHYYHSYSQGSLLVESQACSGPFPRSRRQTLQK